MSEFKPMKFDFGKIHMTGGHSAKSHPLTSKTITGPEQEESTFVKMAVSETWLIMTTTGQAKCTGSSFGRTSLLEDLRMELQKLCDGEESSVSPAKSKESEDWDPMAEVEQVDQDVQNTTKTRSRGQKRTRYYKNHVSKQVVTLSMPARCPKEAPNCTEVRNIRLFIEDRVQVWLDLADVEWALRYLYVPNLLKGVPLIPEDSIGPVNTTVGLVAAT